MTRALTPLEVKTIEFAYISTLAAVARQAVQRLREIREQDKFTHSGMFFGMELHDGDKDTPARLFGFELAPRQALIDSTGLSEQMKKDLTGLPTSLLIDALENAFVTFASQISGLQITTALGFLPNDAVQEMTDTKKAFENADPTITNIFGSVIRTPELKPETNTENSEENEQ